MKTTYLFIIILVLRMTFPDDFAVGESGGEGAGEGGSGTINTTNTSATVPYQVSGNTGKHSHNIWDRINEEVKKHRADPNRADKHITKLQRRLAKPNKKIDELIYQMRLRALLGNDPNALKKLDQRIDEHGKRAIATSFVMDMLGGI